MATQQDLQELLRLQTARKMPMKDGMAQIRALQLASLRSIKQIADAPLPDVESALKDAKAARALQNACKAHGKRMQTSPSGTTPSKRPAVGGPSSQAKRAKYAGSGSTSDGFLLGPPDLTPQQLEASLALPLDMDEERIARTAVETNRAPLVLAFAVELLRHTMPEQPPSSRLSLAQAVVSANSRSKAVNIGLEKGPSADEEGYGEGQPRIRVMGREIAVLKRSGYEWKGEEEEKDAKQQATAHEETDHGPELPASTSKLKHEDDTPSINNAMPSPAPANTWSTSSFVSLKKSTFIARATTITDSSQRPKLLKALFDAHPELRDASHNVWAYRIRPAETSISTQVRESSHDDGESGGGDCVLRTMREANVVDTLVVMTRWYGGVMLGPDRWRLMRNVVSSALSERLRVTGVEASLAGEAVWGLDLEAIRNKSKEGGRNHGAFHFAGGLVYHRPEAARSYLLRNFASASVDDGGDNANSPATKRKHTTVKAQDAEKEENLGLLLGALRLLFDSWAEALEPMELDRRAWGWYTAVRPDVSSGASGWGAKGTLKLSSILDLRRKAE
ncbi:hypothetical protein BD289DRAFT_378453 [Coniella lustricola]|uniref:Impact N-terminal domain-containing protein n=1 Tax=Coniella lustricola TaxID=2025994 RepID=A0A2T2ZU14_9PEZI|nr:hypothetical protein BD289DRAFT_378453 [Coniella lustricola]